MISIYFGAPGSGKSTFAAYYSRKYRKKYDHIYCNFPLKDCITIDSKDIGLFGFENSLIIIDEAGIDFNNRKFKTLPQEAIQYFKLHRHYKTDIIVFSQSYDDMDITIRRLADRIFFIKRSFIKGIFSVRRIKKTIDIDETTKQIIDAYFKVPFSTKFILGRLYWKFFDSFAKPPLPVYEDNARSK